MNSNVKQFRLAKNLKDRLAFSLMEKAINLTEKNITLDVQVLTANIVERDVKKAYPERQAIGYRSKPCLSRLSVNFLVERVALAFKSAKNTSSSIL